MRKMLNAYPLSAFCKKEGITPQTVLYRWRETGQAPDLIEVNGRYRITHEAWAKWLDRREIDRIRTGNSRLRAPIGPTPLTRHGKIKMRESLEGL